MRDTEIGYKLHTAQQKKYIRGLKHIYRTGVCGVYAQKNSVGECGYCGGYGAYFYSIKHANGNTEIVGHLLCKCIGENN